MKFLYLKEWDKQKNASGYFDITYWKGNTVSSNPGKPLPHG
jgi:hypothetical protein